MADFPPWFHQFCAPGADRHEVLKLVLSVGGVPFEVQTLGPHRHFLVNHGRPAEPSKGEKFIIAHYDRVPGAPGANDNGASVLALVEYLMKKRKKGLPLRVVFSDGEELTEDAPLTSQGIHGLAKTWGHGNDLFPVVLDMTGIGDTFVLGHGAEQIWRTRNAPTAPAHPDAFARLRVRARRFLATCGAGDPVEINTPFSDDLGLFLAGIPAVQLSLLPRKEALAYKKGSPADLPPSWRTMHTSGDTVATLWPRARLLVQEMLEKLENFPI